MQNQQLMKTRKRVTQLKAWSLLVTERKLGVVGAIIFPINNFEMLIANLSFCNEKNGVRARSRSRARLRKKGDIHDKLIIVKGGRPLGCLFVLFHAMFPFTRAEDRATLESDPSADAGVIRMERASHLWRGFSLFTFPSGNPKSDKLILIFRRYRLITFGLTVNLQPDIHLRHRALSSRRRCLGRD